MTVGESRVCRSGSACPKACRVNRRVLLVLPLALFACAPVRPRVAVPPPPTEAYRAVPPKPVWSARRVVADAVETPQGRVHTVKPGETGIAIARAYGIDWGQVLAANKLRPPYTLEVGDRLLLPSKRAVAAMSPDQRARAFRLDIDDLITGGEPAAGGAVVAAVRPPRSRAATLPPPAPPASGRGVGTPLPEPTGDAPRFVWPVEGRVMSAFGAKPGGRFNDGVNLKASAGAAVRAAGDGVVAYAGDAIPGFGNLVLVKHAGGWVSAYGHNDALLVARGARVRQGDVIARAGATGAVTEPQVHFELRRGRVPVDPAKVIGGR